jgi:hypothetical protein
MFAKADPRSIRYNSQIGVMTVNSESAGIMGSIWPDGYFTPPPMAPGSNPASYAQTIGDYGPSAGNPYNENTSVTAGDAIRPIVMNRPFRSVGEMGYAFRDQPFKTLDFSSANSSDAGLLDLFSVIDYPRPTPTVSPTPTPTPRAGVISLNSRQSGAIAAVLASTTRKENALTPSLLAATDAINTATIFASLTTPVTNKAGLATLVANASPSPSPSVLDPSVPKTERESVVRALGEADQTRTWNLMIDVIAQTGHYKPNANSLQNDFIVEGEQHYWVHVAIDRFTGQVIVTQIEVVNE